jgi:hypothetical protein
MLRSTVIAGLVSLALFAPAKAEDIPTAIAVLQGLDKVTARVKTFEVPINSSTRFGTLSITVRACYTRPPEETPENTAFLEITDLRTGEAALDVFRGWMFSSSPALSAAEHPVYDVWVLECRAPKG